MTRFAYGLQMLVASQILLVITVLPLIFGVFFFNLDMATAYDLGMSGALVAFSLSFIACLIMRKYSKYFVVAMASSLVLALITYASCPPISYEYKSYAYMICAILYTIGNILIMNGINRVLLQHKELGHIKNGKVIIGVIVAIVAIAILSNFATFTAVGQDVIPAIMLILIIFGYIGATYYYIIAHGKLKDTD
ncbi:MAG: hypothetical protein HUJ63_05770 [Enterococcus sp.]|nr:hypothetical protein [Enterococcus sp.]